MSSIPRYPLSSLASATATANAREGFHTLSTLAPGWIRMETYKQLWKKWPMNSWSTQRADFPSFFSYVEAISDGAANGVFWGPSVDHWTTKKIGIKPGWFLRGTRKIMMWVMHIDYPLAVIFMIWPSSLDAFLRGDLTMAKRRVLVSTARSCKWGGLTGTLSIKHGDKII